MRDPLCFAIASCCNPQAQAERYAFTNGGWPPQHMHQSPAAASQDGKQLISTNQLHPNIYNPGTARPAGLKAPEPNSARPAWQANKSIMHLSSGVPWCHATQHLQGGVPACVLPTAHGCRFTSWSWVQSNIFGMQTIQTIRTIQMPCDAGLAPPGGATGSSCATAAYACIHPHNKRTSNRGEAAQTMQVVSNTHT